MPLSKAVGGSGGGGGGGGGGGAGAAAVVSCGGDGGDDGGSIDRELAVTSVRSNNTSSATTFGGAMPGKATPPAGGFPVCGCCSVAATNFADSTNDTVFSQTLSPFFIPPLSSSSQKPCSPGTGVEGGVAKASSSSEVVEAIFSSTFLGFVVLGEVMVHILVYLFSVGCGVKPYISRR